MLVYQNLRGKSPISAVEFAEHSVYSHAFLHIRRHEELGQVKQWLAETGQHIVAETIVNDHPLLVVGGLGKDETMQALKARGDNFGAPDAPKKKGLKDPWVWRGITSFAGQFLTLFGSFTNPNTSDADKKALIGFASSNIVANVSNIIFGQQKKEDAHQLRFLKAQINEQLGERLPMGAAFPGIDENRSSLRQEQDTRGIGQKAFDIGQKYSVSGGEIGLRLFGATNLAFPVTKWGKIGTALSTGSVQPIQNDNPVTYNAGLVTLLGKFVSLASKEPDPFNPKPPSLLDKFREKVTFRLSSVIEGVGAVMIAKDRLEKRDWYGFVGNAIFVGGYAIRLLAPFGERQVNMKELNAHITDCVAGMPQDQIAQCLADVATDLNRHFKGKGPSIAEMYTNLAIDLKKHHEIDLFSPEASSGIVAKTQAKSAEPALAATAAGKDAPAMEQQDAPAYASAPSEQPRFAQESMKRSIRPETLPPQPATYQDRVAAEPAPLARGLR